LFRPTCLETTVNGIPFENAKERILKLREAVIILKKMWTEEKPTFKGKYYSVNDAINFPKPIQKPYPKIWIGGSGEKLMLRVIAEVSDGWDTVGVRIEDYRRKLSILESYATKFKRNVSLISLSWSGQVIIGYSKEDVKRKIEKYKPENVSYEDYVAGRIVGVPEECIERIEEYRKLGVVQINAIFPEVKSKEDMSLFAEKVIRYYNSTKT
ncbi:MAG: LLM class flavin-dependent oxidoreductase, partial [Thermoproteota archaeon]